MDSTEKLSPPASTLELAKHDATAGAPERGRAITAPRSDRGNEAPQAAPGTEPEILYSDTPPEALAESEKQERLRSNDGTTAKSHRLSPRVLLSLSLIIAMITAIAIGAGLGVGLQTRRFDANPSTYLVSTVTRTAMPSPTGFDSSFEADQRILDDTSLTALELPNGDRRLFFQDFSGKIRQAFFSSTTKEWKADVRYVVASDAKNYTPLAVVDVPSLAENRFNIAFSGSLAVFYISANNSLACAQFQQGAWASTGLDSSDIFSSISAFTASKDTRHLSVSLKQVGGLPSALLFFESTDNHIKLMNGSLTIIPPKSISQPSGLPNPTWTWHDNSDELQKSHYVDNSSLRFSVPFIASSNWLEALFSGTQQDGSLSRNLLLSNIYNSTDGRHLIGSEELDTNLDPILLRESDLLTIDTDPGSCCLSSYAFWVNDTSLTQVTEFYSPLANLPDSPYPFKRLAGFLLANSTSFVIYHQLNASAFFEDHWDDSLGGWVSSSFAISTYEGSS